MTDMMNGLHESSSEKSPRFGNLGFLKGFTERKTTRGKQNPIDPLLLHTMMLNTMDCRRPASKASWTQAR